MRAAGTDATELFEEEHQWVNYKSMLESCVIGPFKGTRAERETFPLPLFLLPLLFTRFSAATQECSHKGGE